MSRLASLACAFLATVAGLATVGGYCFRDAIQAGGQVVYADRDVLLHETDQLRGLPGCVVWLGDSTLMSTPDFPTLLRGGGLPDCSRILAISGLESFGHYLLVHDVVATRPAMVVLLAHLRFLPGHVGRNVVDLSSELPWRELPRTFTLPFHARDTTAPHMLLVRALTWPSVAAVTRFVAGAREAFALAPWWNQFGSNARAGDTQIAFIAQGSRKMIASYDTPVTPATPGVRFLVASVRAAQRARVPAVVLVNPIPYEAMERIGHYDAATVGRRIAVLRAEIDRAGGTLIDAHAELPEAEFADRSGHMRSGGHTHLATVLRPTLEALYRASRLPAH